MTALEFFSRSLYRLGLMDRWPSLEQSLLQGRSRKVPVLDTYMRVLSCIWSMCDVCCPLYVGVVATVLLHTGFLWFCGRGVLGSHLQLPLKQAGWSASLPTVSVTVLVTKQCSREFPLCYRMVSAFCSREETEPWFSASGVYLASRLMYEKCVVPPCLLTVS